MNKCNSIFNKKKGIIALDALVGTILSVIALFFVVSTIASIFLETPTNEKIAQANAQSIVDFVDYFSQGDYSSLKNCYSTLKLFNLENIQFEGNDIKDNYFYIIDSKGVYILSLKYYEDFIDDYSNFKYENFKNKKYDFKNNVDIWFEDTDKGSNWYKLFLDNPDAVLNFKNKADLLILSPIFDNNQNYFYNFVCYDNKCEKINDNVWEDTHNPYIVYKNEDKKLFLAKNDLSNLYIKNQLCVNKYFNKKNQYSNLNSEIGFKNLDYINFDIEFYFKKNNDEYKIKFYWENGPICKDSGNEIDCLNLFKSIQIKVDKDKLRFNDLLISFSNYPKYEDFIDLIFIYIRNNDELNGFELKNKRTQIIFEDYNKKNINIDTNILFDIYNIESNKIEYKNINLDLRDSPWYRNYVYKFNNLLANNFLNNEKFNGVEEDYSNKFIYEDGVIYYYKEGDKDNAVYKRFNEINLRKYISSKKKLTFFLNGKIVEYELKKGINREGNEIDIYKLIIIKDSEYYEVLISNTQVTNIQDLEYKNKENVENYISGKSNSFITSATDEENPQGA